AIKIDPDLIQAHYGLGLVLQKKGLTPQALSEINTTLELSKKADTRMNNKNSDDIWEKILWFNQQKCIYFTKYFISALSGDTTRYNEAFKYINTKLIKDETCIICHIKDNLAINYIPKKDILKNYFNTHENMKNKEFVHRPVSDNNCLVCHTLNKHEDDFEEIASAQEICSKCHKYKKNAEHIHAPVKDGKCIECHDSHSAPYSSLLKQKLVKMCYDCHKETDTSDRNHVIFKKGECVDCHVSHESFNPSLLEDNLSEVCFNCHEQEKQMFSKDVQHGPFKEGMCTPCHKIHGTKREYKREDLCYDCHNKGGTTVQSTSTLTSFRNGDLNLHEKHFNFILQGKPITCESCHQLHASEQKFLLQKGIKHNPRWGYTIAYTKTEDGGRCVVGCHKPREYGRTNAIDSMVWK
ncbi:cytochrome c3 family protein, partial [Candidatus Desantisbacteria bacterium]|nr:cytochrome c3 family protein [Candidatus Desantisbacteria bacterium]